MSDDKTMLAWAASKIQAEQLSKTYGEVTFKFQNGKITHWELKRTGKPEVIESGKKVDNRSKSS